MNRYSPITILKTEENPIPRYRVVKYPLISLDLTDIYVYTAQGDRYDILAQAYYNDPSLWWIINRANPSQSTDSLYPTIGSQIRIPSPSRTSVIISQYENLNK